MRNFQHGLWRQAPHHLLERLFMHYDEEIVRQEERANIMVYPANGEGGNAVAYYGNGAFVRDNLPEANDFELMDYLIAYEEQR